MIKKDIGLDKVDLGLTNIDELKEPPTLKEYPKISALNVFNIYNQKNLEKIIKNRIKSFTSEANKKRVELIKGLLK